MDFFLFSFVEKFQFSFNFESSVTSFSAEFSGLILSFCWFLLSLFSFHIILIEFLVKLSFSRILELNFNLLFNFVSSVKLPFSRIPGLNVSFWLTLSVDFRRISWETFCLFEYLSAIQEASDETFLLAIFFCLNSPVHMFVLRILIAIVDK